MVREAPMMMFTSTMFVLQRRINQPLGQVERVLCDPHVLRGGTEIPLSDNGTLLALEAPFGVTFPPFGLEGASWLAPAAVRTRRGRTVVRLELEVNAWSPGATELLVRPRARRPWRWTGRRLREYFRVAHLAADLLGQVLGTPAATAPAGSTAPDDVMVKA